MTDYNKAATKAAETLVKYCVRSAPVSPLPILKQLDNTIVLSFAEMSDTSGIDRSELIHMFGKNRDAVTSVQAENGKQIYVVGYNSMLPFNMLQRALAREIGHIVLRHEESTPDTVAEAECFVHHLLCPRALIHSIQALGMRLTVDLLANLTGVFDQSLVGMRRIPGTDVSPVLNCFVRSNFMPFIMNFFEFYRYVMPKDGSALADLGTYMDGYAE